MHRSEIKADCSRTEDIVISRSIPQPLNPGRTSADRNHTNKARLLTTGSQSKQVAMTEPHTKIEFVGYFARLLSMFCLREEMKVSESRLEVIS
ncbi:hypothetical protein DPMN_117828 [Dreissena polymorpha]|uniref:Uncharacterized protein n=1 Tax=Dreissena polymorpha TaxID=45954 RepID=A0A9D4GJQ3_DREPO|nr:hypothetical protein DPMN_117828 [Dreissena polymorpha]